jgi:hypothetical protein
MNIRIYPTGKIKWYRRIQKALFFLFSAITFNKYNKNIFKYEVEDKIQNTEVYLDYATLPTIAYFNHFIKRQSDKTTIRLFGLSRFIVSQEIINAYPKGVIRFASTKDNNQKAFNELFESTIRENNKTKYNLTFHLNLSHWHGMLIPLLNIILKYKNKIADISLNLYDDGAEGIVSLEKIKEKYNYSLLEETINHDALQLSKLIKEKVIEINDMLVARYLLGNIFKSHYHLIYDYSNDKALSPLLKNIKTKNTFKKINKISNTKLALDLFNIKDQSLQEILHKSSYGNAFLFIGTTMFNLSNENEKYLTNLHTQAIDEYLNPQSKDYIGNNILFIKGHPNSKKTNALLQARYPQAIHLPENIPVEILYNLGFTPKSVGGFFSTSFLFTQKEKIKSIIFIRDEFNLSIQEEKFFQDQTTAHQIMLRTQSIHESQVRFLSL